MFHWKSVNFYKILSHFELIYANFDNIRKFCAKVRKFWQFLSTNTISWQKYPITAKITQFLPKVNQLLPKITQLLAKIAQV